MLQGTSVAPPDPDNLPSTSSSVSVGSFQQAFAIAIASGNATDPVQGVKSSIDVEELLDDVEPIVAGKHHKGPRSIVTKNSSIQVKNIGNLYGNNRRGGSNVSLAVGKRWADGVDRVCVL